MKVASRLRVCRLLQMGSWRGFSIWLWCQRRAGAGFRPGQVIGQTDARAEGPETQGFSPDDIAASFLAGIGLNPQKEYDSGAGRPITAIRDGNIISGLLAAS